jgi:outer membrane protein assembly factor BamB
MNGNRTLKRWLFGGLTAAVFAGVIIIAARNTGEPNARADEKKDDTPEVVEGWPAFGGTPARNFVNLKDKDIVDKWDVGQDENIRWSADLGSRAYGGPTVGGGRVFVGTNNDSPRDPTIKGDKGVIMCFEEKTGKFLWQIVHDKLEAGQVQDWPKEGICSSPTIDGDRIYYVSNRCEVVCADVNGDPKKPGHGKILWTYDMRAKNRVFPHNLSVCSPLLVGDNLYVVTANGVEERHLDVPQPGAPSFLCLKKKDGEFVWKSNLPSAVLDEAKKKGGNVNIRDLTNKGLLLMHGQWSNPVYANVMGTKMVIFPGGDGWLYAFKPESKNPDGELLWKFDCNPKDAFYELGGKGTRNDFIGTPVVWQNKLYIGVGQDPEHRTGVGHLWCIDITKTPKNDDKDLSPATKPGAKQGDPPQTIFDPKDPKNKDSALVWHYGGIIPKDSPIKRPFPYLFGRSMSTCAVHDGLLYTSDLNGYVYCFDARTGEKYWEYFTKSQIWGSPYWVDGKVYLGNDNEKMFIFKHGKEKKEPTVIDMGGAVRPTPIAANGALFVLTENDTKLLCIGKK